MRGRAKSPGRVQYGKCTQAGAPKKGQGTMSLAGSRGGAPLWGLGQRPNSFSGAQLQESRQQGAGSEASLPVTSRSRRSAPKLLYPTSMQCRARWARPDCLTSDHSWSFPQAEISPLRRRPKGFPIALWKPSVRTLPCGFPLACLGNLRIHSYMLLEFSRNRRNTNDFLLLNFFHR